MINYSEQIRQLIQKQKELWTNYKKALPHSDMIPGEKRRRIQLCDHILSEISSIRAEIRRVDSLRKAERYLGDRATGGQRYAAQT